MTLALVDDDVHRVSLGDHQLDGIGDLNFPTLARLGAGQGLEDLPVQQVAAGGSEIRRGVFEVRLFDHAVDLLDLRVIGVGGDIENASARTPFDAMRKGDEAGKQVVDTYIRYLACGIVNLINIFQPEVLCIGGGVCNEGDYLLKPLLEIVNTEQYSRYSLDKTEIKIAKLGNDAGIIGAAMLSL